VTLRSTTPNFPQRQAGTGTTNTHGQAHDLDLLSTSQVTSRARDQRPAASTRTSPDPVTLLFAFTNRTGEQVLCRYILAKDPHMSTKNLLQKNGGGPWAWKSHDATNFTGRGNCIYTSEAEEVPLHVWISSCRAARTDPGRHSCTKHIFRISAKGCCHVHSSEPVNTSPPPSTSMVTHCFPHLSISVLHILLDLLAYEVKAY